MSEVLPILPTKLLSLWSPWWWFICHGQKRRENRDWPHIPSFRGDVWIHASLKGEENVAEVIVEVLRTIPLPRGRKPPTLKFLESYAGHIVGRVRVTHIERNTPRICLADRWAREGQLGLVFDRVEALDVPIPWKGGQGLVSVSPPEGPFVVQAISKYGGWLNQDNVPSAVQSALERFGDWQRFLPKLVADGQLRREGGLLFTRGSPKALLARTKKRETAPSPTLTATQSSAAPLSTQQTLFEWQKS